MLDRTKRWRENNKEKIQRDNKEWTLKNPEKRQASALRKNHKMTLEEYNLLLEKQNHVCKICGNVCSTGKRLSVDHNHSTNVIRGLLCDKCNRGLGYFNDNPTLLSRASEYLRDTDCPT